MKIQNIEKIKGWTTPGNPSTKPIVTEVEIGILDYTFDIRYYGIRYTMTILRDEFDSIGGFGRHKIGFQTGSHQFETTIYQRAMKDMREFYDIFHTMLHRINQGTFGMHYPTPLDLAK